MKRAISVMAMMDRKQPLLDTGCLNRGSSLLCIAPPDVEDAAKTGVSLLLGRFRLWTGGVNLFGTIRERRWIYRLPISTELHIVTLVEGIFRDGMPCFLEQEAYH